MENISGFRSVIFLAVFFIFPIHGVHTSKIYPLWIPSPTPQNLEMKHKSDHEQLFDADFTKTIAPSAAPQDNVHHRASAPRHLTTVSIVMTCGSVCENGDWYKLVRCNDRDMETIPISSGCDDAHTLELQNNSIASIESQILRGYGRVITLDLSRNQIDCIQPGTFEHTNHLENIFLSRNRIKELRNGTFRGTHNRLQRLYLDRNEITEIGKGALEGLHRLKTLTFSNNRINFLHEHAFSDLYEMQFLHLSHNELTCLHQNLFYGPSKLTSIALDHNQITFLPYGLLTGLSSLTSVDLSFNQIKSILTPSDLGLRHSLQYLNFYSNNITSSENITDYLFMDTALVILSSNPFECDCNFKEIQKWFNSRTQEDQMFITNRSPLECRWNGSLIQVNEDLSHVCENSLQPQITVSKAGTLVASSSEVDWSTKPPQTNPSKQRATTNGFIIRSLNYTHQSNSQGELISKTDYNKITIIILVFLSISICLNVIILCFLSALCIKVQRVQHDRKPASV